MHWKTSVGPAFGSLGLTVALLLPLTSRAEVQDGAPDQAFAPVQELDATTRFGIETTPVLHAGVTADGVEFRHAPWMQHIQPYNTDPGAASMRNEPNYQPGVLLLTF